MKIALVAPEQAFAGGNTTTVRRWEEILRALGHEIEVCVGEPGPADLLVALHARKSASAIAAFRGPVVVAATGTDLYLDLPASEEAMASLLAAWRIVVLHPLASRVLPAVVRERVRVIRQSVVPLREPLLKDEPYTVAVVGHLRAVKAPLLVAEAARLLPATSRIRVLQVGAALEPELAVAARSEESSSLRYRWMGPVARDEALRILARAHLLAVPSLVEGGANVIGEALVHRVPPIASRIDGNVGLLGEDWPGLFAPGDGGDLAALLDRWEHDEGLRDALADRCARLAGDFAPDLEIEAWRSLIGELRA